MSLNHRFPQHLTFTKRVEKLLQSLNRVSSNVAQHNCLKGSCENA